MGKQRKVVFRNLSKVELALREIPQESTITTTVLPPVKFQIEFDSNV